MSPFLPFFLAFLLPFSSAQQPYPSQFLTIDCTVHHPENAGYLCDRTNPSCSTLAYYRVLSGPYSTLSSLATSLFGTNASAVAQASGLSSSSANVNVGQGLYIPIQCSCSGNYSAENVTYTIQPGDLVYKLSNNTYEGLTTCQAMQDANPTANVYDLQINQTVIFPLRCACPSQQQRNRGVNWLVTYPVADGDSVSSISNMFGTSVQEFMSANSLNSTTTSLFSATTVLIPFLTPPTDPPQPTSNASTPPSQSPSSSSHSSNNWRTGVYIAVAIVAAVVAIIAAGCFVVKRRRSSQHQLLNPSSPPPKPTTPVKSEKGKQYSLDSVLSFPPSERLKTYTLDELKQATQDFSPSNHIRGNVYRGVIKGQVVAVKNMNRNVSKELQILQTMHHANIVSLLGVCTSSPEQSYLVYEYAENGSLSDWLHDGTFSVGSGSSTSILPWNSRLRVALDVATALEYIHEHTNPSFVHKDIKSSNILLDSRLRGKVANFGLARSKEDMEQGEARTRHIEGTQGYLPPEYLNHGMVSDKMDVFAFGVVLLEILSGEEALLRGREQGFLWEAISPVLEGNDAKEKLRRWIDPRLQNAYPLDCAHSVAEVAKSCVDEDPGIRPNMRQVVYVLSKLLECSLEWEPSTVMEENYSQNPLEAR